MNEQNRLRGVCRLIQCEIHNSMNPILKHLRSTRDLNDDADIARMIDRCVTWCQLTVAGEWKDADELWDWVGTETAKDDGKTRLRPVAEAILAGCREDAILNGDRDEETKAQEETAG